MMAAARVLALACLWLSTHTLSAAPSKPDYKDVVFSWGVVLGSVGAIIVWYEECSSRHPDLRLKLEAAFTEWKHRSKYMDSLRASVYKRAIREGGEVEAVRLSNEMKAASARDHTKLRQQLRNDADMNCGILLTRLTTGAFDPAKRYKNHVDILRRAAD